MSIKLSVETIAALRKLHAETPPGDWRYSYTHVTAFSDGGGEEHVCNFTRTQNRGQSTAAFIAEAHARFPELLDLAAEAQRLREVIATMATGMTTYPGRGSKRCKWCGGKPETRDGLIEHTPLCPTSLARGALR